MLSISGQRCRTARPPLSYTCPCMMDSICSFRFDAPYPRTNLKIGCAAKIASYNNTGSSRPLRASYPWCHCLFFFFLLELRDESFRHFKYPYLTNPFFPAYALLFCFLLSRSSYYHSFFTHIICIAFLNVIYHSYTDGPHCCRRYISNTMASCPRESWPLATHHE